MNRLQGNTIEKALQNFGLTEKETQIYIFLAKHGVQTGGEIARRTRTAKAVVYRVLKILQRKGFVESTLEFPVRYTAVPFETILDSNIRVKHEEARQIEDARKGLLVDWSKISRGEPESPIEKFVVIEGNQKIYNKIYQMVKQTEHQLSIIATLPGIMRSDRYGITNEIINHPQKAKISFRFLTDITNADLKAVQFLKKKLKASVDLRGRNPELGLEPFPRMVLRDQEEILFFITPTKQADLKTEDTCLNTNCKSMIQAFSSVFEDLWLHSTDIKKKIEIQTGKIPPQTTIISSPEKAKAKYFDALNEAKREVVIVTSSTGLFALMKQTSILENWSKRDIAAKILAPITNENLVVAHQLLQWCELRHVPLGYYETTIVDDQHLFQFNNSSTNQNKLKFEHTLYTNDLNYIQKKKKILFDIWLKTRTPSSETIKTISNSIFARPEPAVGHQALIKETSFMRNAEYEKTGKISESDVLGQIKRERKQTNPKNPTWWDTLRYFGSVASAIIEPAPEFRLPKMVFWFNKYDEDSPFGAENYIVVLLWQETDAGNFYVPSAMVLDRPEPSKFRKEMLAGFPAENNIQIFSQGEIQFRLKGDTFFAGWTRPIALGIKGHVIPPSCVLFEGYGDVKSGRFNNAILSGRQQEVWYNSLDAFVSYFHPQSKYVGSGTEGYIEKDWVLISRPPKQNR